MTIVATRVSVARKMIAEHLASVINYDNDCITGNRFKMTVVAKGAAVMWQQ